MNGVAFDVGTTTVVGYLWDLERKLLLGSISKENPQISGTEADRPLHDVISRISFCSAKEGNLLIMHNLIISCLNEIICEFELKNGIEKDSIEKIVAVGNTTMSHILLNIDPRGLAMAPFKPGFTGPVTKEATEIGIKAGQGCKIHVMPNIAGHVGSDMVAVLLATGVSGLSGTSLIVDIGTNGEIGLKHGKSILCCSTAAGPAFEGSKISHGMRADDGAIEGVSYDQSRGLILKIIGEEAAKGEGKEVQPRGICGSGLVDAVSIALEQGWMDKTGRILLENGKNGERSIILYKGNEYITSNSNPEKSIEITQKDIREVQFAKGAISTGINVLLQLVGLDKEEDIDRIFLAGAFGNYMDINSAKNIGILPDVESGKIRSVGNGAGAGASMALLDDEIREKAASLAESIEHVELADYPDFQKIFLDAMSF